MTRRIAAEHVSVSLEPRGTKDCRQRTRLPHRRRASICSSLGRGYRCRSRGFPEPAIERLARPLSAPCSSPRTVTSVLRRALLLVMASVEPRRPPFDGLHPGHEAGSGRRLRVTHEGRRDRRRKKRRQVSLYRKAPASRALTPIVGIESSASPHPSVGVRTSNKGFAPPRTPSRGPRNQTIPTSSRLSAGRRRRWCGPPHDEITPMSRTRA